MNDWEEKTSIDDVRDLVSYDPRTGVLTWNARDVRWFSHCSNPVRAQKSWNARYAGSSALNHTNDHGYSVGNMKCLGASGVKAHRVAFAIHQGRWPMGEVDHINHRRSDNRIKNLREVSDRGNARNHSQRSDNSSGKTGVHFCTTHGRWIAQIGTGNGRKKIGSFMNFGGAVEARTSAERELGYHENHGRKSS